MSVQPKRNELIDGYRGIAILLMILGHGIQYSAGMQFQQSAALFENPIFKLIYSFHMPFFMLISGYLFGKSFHKHSVEENIAKRFTSLLVPIFIWSCIWFVLEVLTNKPEVISLGSLASLFKEVFTKKLWFLWAVFLCSLIVICVECITKKGSIKAAIYLAILCCTFVMPDKDGNELYKYMYPFFMAGFFAEQHQKALFQFVKAKRIWILIGSGILFVALLVFYRASSYIYTSGYYIFRNAAPLRQCVVDIYRFIIGFAGSVFALISIYSIWAFVGQPIKNIFIKLGQASMGIYIISSLLFIFVIRRITPNGDEANYFIALITTISVCAVSYLATKLFQKNKLLNKIFLGGR